MTSLSLKAEKIHNEFSVRNFIIKELKWYKNPMYIHHSILSLTSIPLFISLGSNSFLYFFLIWGLSMGITQFVLMNYINRLIYFKYKKPVKKAGIIWKFSNDKIQKKKMKLFYKRLVSKKILLGNENDVPKLELIEEDIKNVMIEPVSAYPLQIYIKKTWPIFMALYLAIITIFLPHSEDIIIDLKLILSYTMLLFVLIGKVLFLNCLILDVLNSRHRKQQQFLKGIIKLKLYLRLKYDKV